MRCVAPRVYGEIKKPLTRVSLEPRFAPRDEADRRDDEGCAKDHEKVRRLIEQSPSQKDRPNHLKEGHRLGDRDGRGGAI